MGGASICFLLFFFFYGILCILSSIEKSFIVRSSRKNSIFKVNEMSIFIIKFVRYYIALVLAFLHTVNFMKSFAFTCNVTLSLIGFSLLVVGMFLRISAIRTLGEFWSYRIELKEGHKIVKSGIYRYLKHPAYLGNIYLVGVLLLFNPLPSGRERLRFVEEVYYFSLVLVLLLLFFFYARRARLENKILSSLRND